jgi:hypothetical protein
VDQGYCYVTVDTLLIRVSALMSLVFSNCFQTTVLSSFRQSKHLRSATKTILDAGILIAMLPLLGTKQEMELDNKILSVYAFE